MNIQNNFENNFENNSENNLSDLEKEFNMFLTQKPQLDITASAEQTHIINILKNTTSNIVVDAVAGSGKTTTVLQICFEYPTKNVFQITYNNMLKREVRNKIKKLSLENITIHTYHSLAVNYYNQNAFTDDELKKIIYSNSPITNYNNSSSSNSIDILIIDETQDMIFDYYFLIKKFITDTKSNPQIVLLGDVNQGIYEFKGTSTKFLTLANKIWDKKFTKCNLSTSYRLTNQIAQFINNIMLSENRIRTIRDGPSVDYYITNPYKIYKTIGKYIVKLIRNKEITPSDIFILIPSVKTSESPYTRLENYLVKHNIHCITPNSDDVKLDEKVILNKVVFTTYHQAKGRERKLVILYNFDSSYMEYFNKDQIIDNYICPNILYVGATRASWKLILIQDYKSKPFEFIDPLKLMSCDYFNVINTNEKNIIIKKNNSKKNDIKKTTVTDMVKFLSSNTLEILIPLVEQLFEETTKSAEIVNIPNKIKIETNNNIIYEDISDLNGLIIPAIYETKINNLLSSVEFFVKDHIKDTIKNDIKKYIGKINIPAKTISDYLKIGNIYQSIQNKLHARIAQIKKYNWLNENMVNECHKKMSMITPNTKFEITPSSFIDTDYIEINNNDLGTVHIKGRIDAIDFDTKTVWEFKCVDFLTIEHKLQVIIYFWLWKQSILYNIYGNFSFNLINIKSGQILNLLDNNYIVEQIIETVLQDKFATKKIIDDETFINYCLGK